MERRKKMKAKWFFYTDNVQITDDVITLNLTFEEWRTQKNNMLSITVLEQINEGVTTVKIFVTLTF